MASRLSSADASLAKQLESEPPAALRRVALQASRLAVMRTQLVDPRLDAALAALRDCAFGDTVERTELQHLTDELDKLAWDIQELAEEGTVSQQAYLTAFARARAAASVGFALASDARNAALEAVYEALAAVSNLDEVRMVVNAALNSPPQ